MTAEGVADVSADVSTGSEDSTAPETLADVASEGAEEVEAKPKPQVPEPKRKFKVKVYDKEEEIEEDELIRRATKVSAADKRFREAAELEKRYNATLENLKKDPWALFKALEMDPHSAAEQLLIEKLKFETMSPEQREAFEAKERARQYEEELKEYKNRDEEQRKSLAEKEASELKYKAIESIDQSLVGALQDAGIKRITPGIVKRVAQKMLAYHQANDGKLLDAKIAVKLALEDRAPEVSEYLEGLSPEEFDKLPATFLEKLRAHFVGQVQSPAAQKSRTQVAEPARRQRKQVMTTDDFFKKLESKFG